MKIIIQAGGKGSRLEGLTHNKPKCLVPVQNRPILFHAFEKFKDTEFIIIADYKYEVLEKYLAVFAKGKYTYRLIRPQGKGTISGLKEALAGVEENESFMILWCDLILSSEFSFPSEKGNYIGISKDFECRWSFTNGQFIKVPSKEDGVAGLFIFENKSWLQQLPTEGAFVNWLSTQSIPFKRLNLSGSKEIGTLLSYTDHNHPAPRCRPFNRLTFQKDTVLKQPITQQGQKIAQDEIAWYQHVQSLGYIHIPQIYSFTPLTMKQVQGKNIFEYDCLIRSQKQEILTHLLGALRELHALEPAQPVCKKSVEQTYLTKTFDRLAQVKELVPFAMDDFIKINGQYYKNVFACRQDLEALFLTENSPLMPKEFVLIHGDCTFSNLMFDTFNMKAILIDPRGYFGATKLYGDADYDWAKLYYSLKGNYDQFNRKKFTLSIRPHEVEFAIKPNNWEDMEEFFFESLPQVNKSKIKLLHALIWLSLTTYAWEDYDSICCAFYNGLVKLGGVF